MKSKNYSGKRGTSSKLLYKYITKELKKDSEKNVKQATENNKIAQKQKKAVKNSKKYGRLHSPDINDISVAVYAIREMVQKGLNVFSTTLMQGKKENINKAQEGVLLYSDTINDLLRRGDNYLQDHRFYSDYIKNLPSTYTAAQAARDGVLMKQETRTEIDENGKKKEIKYDVSMSDGEVIRTLNEYRDLYINNRYNQAKINIDIGMNLIGIMGIIYKNLRNDRNIEEKQSFSVVSAGIISVSLIKLLCRDLSRSNWGEAKKLKNIGMMKSANFLNNEQISFEAEQDTIEEVKNYLNESMANTDKANNIQSISDATASVITAIVSGIYISSQIKSRGKKLLDSKILAECMMSLGTTKGYVGNILQTISRIQSNVQTVEELKVLAEKVEEIESQLQEKVYPLISSSKPFDSFKIENLDGKFYPTTDYETGDIKFATNIKVPEFSVKRGQTVLLTGDSGAGKSTFLRLLKRGDINNRGCIKLDNGDIVDNLGKECISIKPSTELGNEGTVLNQITGKDTISELDSGQKENLVELLKEMNLYKDGILDEMASKKFMQFSTGQQRRLALSKMLYRISDDTSVIIVDEPVRKCSG